MVSITLKYNVNAYDFSFFFLEQRSKLEKSMQVGIERRFHENRKLNHSNSNFAHVQFHRKRSWIPSDWLIECAS